MVYYHVSTQLHVGYTIYPTNKSFSGWSEFAFNTRIQTYSDFISIYNYLKNSSVHSDTNRTFNKWLCETLFESIRQQRFPDCPTRIFGTFLCKDLNESRIFNKKRREGKGTIFLVDTENTVDFFDMQIFTDAETSLYNRVSDEMYNYCVELAVKYWKSKNDNSIIEKEYICMEILLLKETVS